MMAIVRFIKLAFCACIAVASWSPVVAMERMEDSELSGVRAQEGVSIGLEVRLNTDASGAPLNGELTNCATGDLTLSVCRFALNAHGRTGEWVLFRGVYGSLLINDIRLDAGILSQAGTTTATWDAARFQDPGGACLLPGGTCSQANLEDDPALVFEYPATTTSYNASGGSDNLGASTGYTSLELGYTIEETRLVFESEGNDFSTGGPTGSFLGVQISDTEAGRNRAGMAISGQAYVYGF